MFSLHHCDVFFHKVLENQQYERIPFFRAQTLSYLSNYDIIGYQSLACILKLYAFTSMNN